MPVVSLRRSHPQLWATVVLICGMHSLVLLVAFIMSNSPQRMLWYAVPAVAVIGVIGFGLISGNYWWLRLGVVGGLALTTLIAFLLLVVLGVTLYEHLSGYPLAYPALKDTAWLIPPWVLFAMVHLLILREPPENPAAERGRRV